MATEYKSITDLPALSEIDDSALLMITVSGASYKILASVLKQYADGKNAYEYAVEQGYKGTETEFAKELANLNAYAATAQTAATAAAGSATTATAAATTAQGYAEDAADNSVLIDRDDSDKEYTLTREVQNGHFVLGLVAR